MRDIVRPAVVLFVIAAVAAALLGFVNAITTEPIAVAEAEAKATNMQAVLDCSDWGEEQTVTDSIITDYTPGLDEGGNTVGYAFSVTTTGYSSGLKLMVGIDMDGVITGVSIVDCSNETPGLGANAAQPYFYEQFTGKSGELTVVKSGTAGDSDIQALTGATITSTAVTEAVNTVSNYFNDNNLKGGA